MKDRFWNFQFDGDLGKRNYDDGRIRILGKRATGDTIEQSWMPQLIRQLGKDSYDSRQQINRQVHYMSFLFHLFTWVNYIEP